jgi:hypothetical protein
MQPGGIEYTGTARDIGAREFTADTLPAVGAVGSSFLALAVIGSARGRQ